MTRYNTDAATHRAVGASWAAKEAGALVDWAITGGLVVDGTGSKPFVGTVCIRDGVIERVATGPAPAARNTLRVQGKIVAPGFVDIHSHSDPTRLVSGLAENKLYQGVTFELAGNCGISVVPAPADIQERRNLYRNTMGFLGLDRDCRQTDPLDIPQYAEQLVGNTIHMGMLVGHLALRGCVMGMESRAPSGQEGRAMEELLDRQLRQGAFGLSLGLVYPPGASAGREELVALGRVVAARDALLAVHMRDESDGILEALDEVFQVAAATGARLHLSHLKLMGRRQWGLADRVLERIAAAGASGLTVSADQYPYDASSSSLRRLVPAWAQAGGRGEMAQRLRDPAQLARMRPEMEAEIERRGGAARIAPAEMPPAFVEMEGWSLERIAESWQCPAYAAAARILAARGGDAACIFHAMHRADVERILAERDIAIGSDGCTYPLDPAQVKGKPHRRNFGAFPQFLQTVRERGLMPIEDAVYKITGRPAAILRLINRGTLRAGCAADITIFDAERIRDRSTYANPVAKPEGIAHVFVEGEPALYGGRMTGARRGRFVRA